MRIYEYDNHMIAYESYLPEQSVPSQGVIFLGGYASNMQGSKALYLDAYCRGKNIPFIRFDYRGHGKSSGLLTDGCISDWLEDAEMILNKVADNQRKYIIIGSSMGGWIAILLAQKYPEKISAFLGVAVAPDFTEELIWQQLKRDHQQQLQQTGLLYLPSEYCQDPSCEPFSYPITLKLIEDGRKHCLLHNKINIHCPVRLLHGMNDKDVPWNIAQRLTENIQHDDVHLMLIKDGAHRMSEPKQLQLLQQTLTKLLKEYSQ